MPTLSFSALVVHLFKTVIAFVVPPIDKDGPLINARAMLAPSFKTDMSGWKSGYRRSLPAEVTLRSISAKDNGSATIAVTITSRLMLSRISDIIDPYGSYEIELRSADIDVRAILNKPGGSIGEYEVIRGIRSAQSSLNRGSDILRWKRLSRFSAVVL